MTTQSIGFYVRWISVLFLIFVSIQCCWLYFMKSSPVMPINKSVDYMLSIESKKDYTDHSHAISHTKLKRLSNETISKLRLQIYKMNKDQMVLNENKFGPLESDSVIIVIQVHKRIYYLRHLISSLSQAKGISKALLVFSHDFYDDEINNYVQAIDFCKVIQIFYPYSIQTHPYEFPGNDPNDCPRNISKHSAIIRNCNNALHPDHFGHYREAEFTQTKHHWWWKANSVFHKLKVTRNHTGLMLFLEEDHYVAEDFLHVLKTMQKTTTELCPPCNILCLGNYLRAFNTHTYRRKTTCLPFNGGLHNMGLAFNRSTWLRIRSCAHTFCKHDDYNWDWSLMHVSENCLENRLIVFLVRGPRVFHIGSCGIHHKSSSCKAVEVLSKIKEVLRLALEANQLYPVSFIVTKSILPTEAPVNILNGGWGDPRDHQMCLNMVLPKGLKGISKSRHSNNKKG